jgi:hypothetical protein
MWEYKCISHTAEPSEGSFGELNAQLNALAKEGWEPVNMTATEHQDYKPVLLYVLMRRSR